MSFQSASQRDLVHLMENREKVSSSAFSELLDEIVQLKGCGWELGPNPIDSNKTILAFSSLGDQANIDRISEEMDLPIVRDEWSAIVGIPPRIWDQYFQYTSTNGSRYEIAGSTWKYAFIESDSKIQILLDSSPAQYEDVCNELGKILCVGELGEENIRRFVSRIYCVALECSESKSVSFLRENFIKQFPDCHYRDVLQDKDNEIAK